MKERRTGLEEIWVVVRKRELMARRLGCKPETQAMLKSLSDLAFNSIMALDENQRRSNLRRIQNKYLSGE